MAVRSFAVQPNSTESYWQPVPANGFVEVHVSKHRTQTHTPFESGVQEVSVDGFVREHAHSDHEELILVYSGTGAAVIEGEEFPMQPGTTLYLSPREKHKFVNRGYGAAAVLLGPDAWRTERFLQSHWQTTNRRRTGACAVSTSR